MSEETQCGKVQLTPCARGDAPAPGELMEIPAFVGDGEIDGNKITASAYHRKDFLGEDFLLVRLGESSKSFGCLHRNPYRTETNKAPHMTGRAAVNNHMLKMAAWQNTDYRGVPVLSVVFEDWEQHMDEYRKRKEQPSLPNLEDNDMYSTGISNDNTDDIPF